MVDKCDGEQDIIEVGSWDERATYHRHTTLTCGWIAREKDYTRASRLPLLKVNKMEERIMIRLQDWVVIS